MIGVRKESMGLRKGGCYIYLNSPKNAVIEVFTELEVKLIEL